ncbi:SAV_2336 N-terminal domain-related protein, partial [Streptomyces sp. NPDC056549]|uniref:SAV_2336 N-terminal domain-related protein n=1 Tax=Streptomyces sp. NPDC056549 TaxID=3345864 RepID=UPI0036ACEE2E
IRRAADPLGAMLRVLTDVGCELDAQGVLDVLWLAGRFTGAPERLPLARAALRTGTHIGATTQDRPADRGGPRQDGPPQDAAPAAPADQDPISLPGLYGAPRREPSDSPGRGGGGPRDQRGDPSVDRSDDETAARRDGAHPGHRDRSRPGLPVLVPERKALPDELLIGRALRPLKRRRASPRRRELDEQATAAALAETRLPDVVTRPARERWLNLHLVVDSGLSMLLWHRLSVELQSALRRLGAFRTIQVHGLDTRLPYTPLLRGRPFTTDGPAIAPSVLTDPSGGSLVLVLSDGMGAAWQYGTMHEVLRAWAGGGPVALVHALPPPLWEGSGIQADRWQATTRGPGGATTGWQITDRVLPRELAAFSGVPVPVLEPTPRALADWARLLTSPGTTVELPLLAPAGRRPDRVAAARHSTSVQQFRDAASPEAYRLAAHLAAVSPASVPVMRLVQGAVPWPAQTAHLAEVFLGGLVHPVPAPVAGPLPAKHRIFDFTEEAKRALLDTVPTAELLHTGRAIGRQLETLAGRSPDFPAWLAHPSGADRLSGTLRSFTSVERRLLARFGVSPQPQIREARVRITGSARWEPLTREDPRQLGPYRLSVRREGIRSVVYLGQDEQGRHAALRTPRPGFEAADRTLITTEAEVLRRMGGRYAPQLLGTGLGQRTPWIAMQPIGPADDPGARAPRLAEVLGQERPANTWVFDTLNSLSMGWHMASALAVCHMSGVVPARFDADSVLVLESTILLTDLSDSAVDGQYASPGLEPTRADNVRALGELLGRISSRPDSGGGVPALTLWNTPSWEPLRDMVVRCFAPDPAHRPTASEVAEVFARYVSLARGRSLPAAGGADARSVAPRPPLLPRQAPHRPPSGPAAGRWLRQLRNTRSARGGGAKPDGPAATIRRPLTHSLRVTVVGAHPGCGRATVTTALGALLAEIRQEPVLAVDGAPLTGDLTGRLNDRNPATPREVAQLPADAPYEEVSRLTTHLHSGLEVLAYLPSHATAGPAYADEYRRVLALTAPHYPVVLTDWAGHRLDAAADTVLAHTDRLVLCCTSGRDSLALVPKLLAGLSRHGWSRLAERAVVVVSELGVAPLRGAEIRERLAQQGAATVVLPFDPHLVGARTLQLSRLKARTATALTDLARVIMTQD